MHLGNTLDQENASVDAACRPRSATVGCRTPNIKIELARKLGLEAEAARLRTLGATAIDLGQSDVPWTVLADPEGNEFCLLAPG